MLDKFFMAYRTGRSTHATYVAEQPAYVPARPLPIVRNAVRRESERRLAKLQLTFGKHVAQNAASVKR